MTNPSFTETLLKVVSHNSPDEEKVADTSTLTYETLERAFPSTRINWDEAKWWHVVWLLYLPFGLILASIRLLCVFLYGNHFMKVMFPTEKWIPGPDAQAGYLPPKTILVVEHHSTFLETSTLCRLLNTPLFVVADAKLKNSFLVANTDKNILQYIFKERNEKLVDTYRKWRQQEPDAPLVVFPQGSTSRENVVTKFMPKLFDALEPDANIIAVGVSTRLPIPLHQRLVTSNFLVDMFWYLFQPTYSIQAEFSRCFKMSEFEDADHAAQFLQETVAAFNDKECMDLSLFDKKEYAKRRQDGYGTSLALIRFLQSNDRLFNLLYYPFALLHFICQEAVLLVVGALLIVFMRDTTVLLTLVRCVVIQFQVVHLIKAFFKVPRPLWLDPHIRASRFVWQHDYSFPSGHSAFVACVFSGLIFNRPENDFSVISIIFFILALVTGFSRVFLGMHHATDIIAGWITGFLVSYIWIEQGWDEWFVRTSLDIPKYTLVIVWMISFISSTLYLYAHQLSNATAHLDRIKAWKENLYEAMKYSSVKHFLLEPHRLLICFLPMGIFTGGMTLLPTTILIGPHYFITRFSCMTDDVVSFFITMGGCALLIVLFFITRRTWVVIRTVWVIIFIWWSFMGSKYFIYKSQQNYTCE